jgi:hypothetical protein
MQISLTQSQDYNFNSADGLPYKRQNSSIQPVSFHV